MYDWLLLHVVLIMLLGNRFLIVNLLGSTQCHGVLLKCNTFTRKLQHKWGVKIRPWHWAQGPLWLLQQPPSLPHCWTSLHKPQIVWVWKTGKQCRGWGTLQTFGSMADRDSTHSKSLDNYDSCDSPSSSVLPLLGASHNVSCPDEMLWAVSKIWTAVPQRAAFD